MRGESWDPRELLVGKVASKPPGPPSNVVRIFTSSTFTDTTEERNILLQRAYPELQGYCKSKYGIEFQIVDMRWGVRDEATDDHQGPALCMREIHNCQQLSLGPNFVALLGQKHGYRPFPSRIDKKEFVVLHNALTAHNCDVTLLEQWYFLDENEVPPVYVLQKISSHIPDFLAKDDELRQKGRREWNAIYNKLQSLLSKAREWCLEDGSLNEENTKKYSMSVTEQEIYEGLLKSRTDPAASCMCFIRIIDDIDKHLDHQMAPRYIDISEQKVDTLAQQKLVKLRDEEITQRLKNHNIFKHHVKWSNDGGISMKSHQKYLEDFAADFVKAVKHLIDKALSMTSKANNDNLLSELMQHTKLCHERNQLFYGRDDVINSIKNLVLSQQAVVAVVHGVSGSGKTSVMAKCVNELRGWFDKSSEPVVVYRFLGTTPESSTLASTLKSVCDQLARVFEVQDYEFPSTWNDTLRIFGDFLQKGTKEKPLVIVLDSLDQLKISEEHRQLKWLPTKTPAHTYIIVSTLPDEHNILEHLKLKFDSSYFVEVPTLNDVAALEVVKKILHGRERKLTTEQLDVIQSCIQACSLPLFVKLTCDEAITWRSYYKKDQIKLKNTVVGVIDDLLEKLENYHGDILVRHSLAYITASGRGLSPVELEDLLSLDDEVLDDVFQYHISPVRRIPQLLWLRIQNDISSYLSHRTANNVDVIYWYHRQFIEVATKRYLCDATFTTRIHTNMVDYYSGKWHGKPKPFKYTAAQQKKLKLSSPDSSADRLVVAQPVIFEKSDIFKESRFNQRKLSQLPYHMIKANMIEDLKSLLFDYEWLISKICALSPHALYDDLDTDDLQSDGECCLLRDCIRIAKPSLLEDPTTLSTEISGSLLPYTRELPYPKLDKLLDQAYYEGVKLNALVAQSHMYTAVDGALKHIVDYPDLPPSYQNCLHIWQDKMLVLLKNNKLLLVSISSGDIDREITLPLPDNSDVTYNVMYPGHPTFTVIIGDASQRGINPVVVYDILKDEFLFQTLLSKVYSNVGFYENFRLSYLLQHSIIFATAVNKETNYFDHHGNLLNSFGSSHSSVLFTDDQMYAVVHEKDSSELIIYSIPEFAIICTSSLSAVPTKVVLTSNSEKAIVMFEKSQKFNIVDLNVLHENHAPVRNIMATSMNDLLKGIRPKNILDISTSRDSHWLIIHVQEKVMLYNIIKLQVQKEFIIESKNEEKDYEVKDFVSALTDDNMSLIVGYGNKILHYSVSMGSLVHQMVIDTSTVAQIHLSQTSKLFVTATEKGRLLKIWDLEKMHRGTNEPHTLSHPVMYMDSSFAKPVVVLRSSKPEKIHVINFKDSNNRTITMEGGSMAPVISQSGSHVLLRHYESQDGAIEIWPTAPHNPSEDERKQVKCIPLNTIYLKAAALSSKGNFVGVMLEEEKVAKLQIWDVNKESLRKEMNTEEGNAADLVFIDNDKILVVVRQSYTDGKNWSVSSYDVSDGKQIFIKNGIRANCAWTHDASGRIVCIEDNKGDGQVIIINGVNGNIISTHQTLPDHIVTFDAIYMVTFDAEGRLMVDFQRKVIDVLTGDLVCHFEPEAKPHTTLLKQRCPKLSVDGKYVAWIDSKMSSIKIGRVSTGKVIGACAAHAVINCFRLCVDNHVMLGCADGRLAYLQIVDPETNNYKQIIQSIRQEQKITRLQAARLQQKASVCCTIM